MARGNWPRISSPNYAKGQGLLTGFRQLASWWIKGACFWHCSHFRTYSAASFCICSHQNPWVIARCASECPPTWLPYTPSCSSSKSSLTFLGCKHRRYAPLPPAQKISGTTCDLPTTNTEQLLDVPS